MKKKKIILISLIFIIAFLLFTGRYKCFPLYVYPAYSSNLLSVVSPSTCEKCGGSWWEVPLRGCNPSNFDAGRPCRDSFFCRGRCLVDPTEKESGFLKSVFPGRCSHGRVLLGCFEEVKHGKVQPSLCIL